MAATAPEPDSALCPTAKLLSLAINGSSEAALLLDVGGRVMHVNASALCLFGKNRAEDVSSYWTMKDDAAWGHAIAHISSAPLVKAANLTVEDGNEISGTVKLTKLPGCPCCDNVYISAYVSVEAEKENGWLTKQHMQDMVDGSFDPMFSVDQVGTILMVNDAAVTLFGWTRDELLGQNISMICGGAHAGKHEKYMRHYKETGETKVMGKKRELPAKKKDGSEFMIELGLREVRHESEVFFCGFVRDLSVQKQHEKEIKHRMEISQAAIDSSFDPMFEIDQRGIISMVNKAAVALFGWEKEEFIGNNISMICGKEHASKHDEYITRYLKTGVKHIIGRKRAVMARRKDGTEFHIELGVQEAMCSGGEKVFCGYVKDLTERKLHQRRMKRQHEVVQDKFFGREKVDS